MTMDPELASMVAFLPAVSLRDLGRARAELDALTEGAASVATDGLVVDDRVIDGPDGPVTIRVYAPDDRPGEVGAFVLFHGGAFSMGGLETEHRRCTEVARDLGVVVVSVDYRLAPEHPFPAGVDDCYAALEWVAGHAAELGVDPARIAVGGSSSGGCTAAAVALMARDRNGPALAFQLLVYPVIDDRLDTASMHACTDTPLFTRGDAELMWGNYLGADRTDVSPYAAPGRAADLTGLPPAYVGVAELDPLRDEGIAYAQRLVAAGVSTELHLYPGTFHGFDALPSSITTRALAEQTDALRRAIAPSASASA